ncbi:hypothetical protein ACGFZP_19705 [Kitasatospora sp. NPDC048239]|uniref:hypothetical protein n=1 Tax=Kitasatospora sp. NPDC048239 TaxID=3364046 RepID=UPI00371EE115
MTTRDHLHTASADRRRTLAWFIARRPGGVIAGALQYRHLRVQMFEGYAGNSSSGFRDEVESEEAIARGEKLGDLIIKAALAGQSFVGPDEIDQATRLATTQLNARAKPWIWGGPLPPTRQCRRRFVYRL